MTFELMTHQREGIDFLTSGKVGLLAFEQGLGKTLVSIDAFRKVRAGGLADKLLIICPNSLKRNWLAEFSKFGSRNSVWWIAAPRATWPSRRPVCEAQRPSPHRFGHILRLATT